MMKETLLEGENNVSVTENGAVGYKSSGHKLLDFNFALSSMRGMSKNEIQNKFADVYYEDPAIAIKFLFYIGDVRNGAGERRTFRICLDWLGLEHIYLTKALLVYVPHYTRWDNLWILLDNLSIRDDVVKLVANQLYKDIDLMKEGKPISLLAKWMPSINTSSAATRKYANILRNGLGFSPRSYRKMLARLRGYLDVVEVKASANRWSEIFYEKVPSKANLKYMEAFKRNDQERREQYLASLSKGETKINSSVAFPHEILAKYKNLFKRGSEILSNQKVVELEEMWKNLPDYVKGNSTTLCVRDGSYSMQQNKISNEVSCNDIATALTIYFAERCKGEYKDKFITFSEFPDIIDLSSGNSLYDKIKICLQYTEVSNTNIEAVFELILKTAIDNKLSQEELPDNILILSDMEFDRSAVREDGSKADDRLFDTIAWKYAEAGYKLPRLVFWNIYSRTNTIPVRSNELGVAIVSGFSPAVLQIVMSQQIDPYLCILDVLSSERYSILDQMIDHFLA